MEKRRFWGNEMKFKRNKALYAEWQTMEINPGNSLGFAELGRKYGISRERVRQLITKMREEDENVSNI